MENKTVEWLNEDFWPMAYDILNQNFGDMIGKDEIWMDRYCHLKNLLDDYDENHTKLIDMTVIISDEFLLKYGQQELLDCIKKIVEMYFCNYSCGHSYDCCGCTFTSNFEMTHKVYMNMVSSLTSHDGKARHYYDFRFVISNGQNY